MELGLHYVVVRYQNFKLPNLVIWDHKQDRNQSFLGINPVQLA